MTPVNCLLVKASDQIPVTSQKALHLKMYPVNGVPDKSSHPISATINRLPPRHLPKTAFSIKPATRRWRLSSHQHTRPEIFLLAKASHRKHVHHTQPFTFLGPSIVGQRSEPPLTKVTWSWSMTNNVGVMGSSLRIYFIYILHSFSNGHNCRERFQSKGNKGARPTFWDRTFAHAVFFRSSKEM